MEIIFETIKTLGKAALNSIGGGDSSGKAGADSKISAAQAAADAKIGFAAEKELSFKIAQAAEHRGASRFTDPKEGGAVPSQYDKIVIGIYRNEDWQNAFVALGAQAARAGRFDVYANTTEPRFASDEDPKVKAMKLG